MPAKKRTPVRPTDSPVRAAIYARVSTDEQAETGYGLSVQLERARAQIVAKGWQLVEPPFVDEGISGTKGAEERPALAALLDAGCSGKVDAVVVLSLDRLGRKTSLVLQLVERLAACGVQLVSCKESLDTSTPQGQFVLTMFAALAELERGVIVERTTAGRNNRGRKDGERGGRLPFGYVRTDDGIAVDAQAAQVVRRMFSLRLLGKSLRAIAAELNENGTPTPRGGTWHASDVRIVLLNRPAYRGGKRGASDVRWPKVLLK